MTDKTNAELADEIEGGRLRLSKVNEEITWLDYELSENQRQQIIAALRDAARYRWLQEHCHRMEEFAYMEVSDWNVEIDAALRRSDNTALILRCRNCGSTNVEDAKPSSDKVLVPRVPTLAMLEAGRISQSFGDEELDLDNMRFKWNAMLDAAELRQEPRQKPDDSSSKG